MTRNNESEENTGIMAGSTEETPDQRAPTETDDGQMIKIVDVDGKVHMIPPPADEMARLVDELWPELEAGVRYLRDH